jgi:DNA ligase D-like protein (predicted ligase)
MLLLSTDRLPDDPVWAYEIKLDGFRAVAFNADGHVHLRSRNDNDFRARYPTVLDGLRRLPRGTVVDGEIVAIDSAGRPDFQRLQNAGSAPTQVVFYVFDVLVLKGSSLMGEPLDVRRARLRDSVLPSLAEPVRYATPIEAPLSVLIDSVKAHGLEGLVAKRRTSHYEPGKRSGAWLKMRVSRTQDFVVGGYTVAAGGFDAVILGAYKDGGLHYVARTRNGFTPATRTQLWRELRKAKSVECPFVNLPEKRAGRWGQGLTPEKMLACRWVQPILVARIAFVEWTLDGHLRHARWVVLAAAVKLTVVAGENLTVGGHF